MKLYNYWRSSCSWRVRISLAWKNIPYDYVPVHLVKDGGEQHKESYASLNPMAQVPTLETDEKGKKHFLTQSMAILEFLEEKFPEPALLPKDPYERAEARRQAEIVNSGIQPYQGPKIGKKVDSIGGKKEEWFRFWNTEGLRALEKAVSVTRGDFCVGNQVSFADLCLVPQLHASRRFGVDLNPYPSLLAVEKKCLDLPAFQISHPDRQPDAEK